MRRLRIKESNIPTDIQNIQANVPDINMKNSYLRGHGAPHRLPGVRRWEQEYSTGPLVYTPYYNNIGLVLDPYVVLGLLGFLVFVFYVTFNFINNNGKRRFKRTTEENNSIIYLSMNLLSNL